jgi:hypothetical protein
MFSMHIELLQYDYLFYDEECLKLRTKSNIPKNFDGLTLDL